MNKIAIDARRIRTSTGRYARQLIKYLQKIDSENEYHVIIHEKDQGTWAPEAENFYLHIVPYDHYTFGEQLGFARFLSKLDVDLVHFTMPQQPLLYIGKRVTTIHDLTLVRFKNLDKNRIIYWVEQSIFKFLLKNVARRSKYVITPTKFVKDDVATYAKIDKDKINVTYEAAEKLSESEAEPVDELKSKDFVMYVGNAYPHKNLEALVDAFSDLHEKYPKLHLALAGKKEFFYEQVEKLVKENDWLNIHFLGFISDEQLAWLYKKAEAYVFPSLSEGFGLPGLEAMQYEVPLISSDATCLPEVYGDAAYYFDPHSVESISEAIDTVLRSETRQHELVAAGNKQLDKYSWERMAKQTHQTYLSILIK